MRSLSLVRLQAVCFFYRLRTNFRRQTKVYPKRDRIRCFCGKQMGDHLGGRHGLRPSQILVLKYVHRELTGESQ